ncbi:hypothetical protein GOBAR_AA18447 [Gossypium barbadense]|uniref:Uncharacterized protein n=1 Tax=Gossypium barbadense TaxID=3634 RepID=A0A2P5XFY9_GOSBA|nr:hypothetical protein GOBAR_AA18447 [Gossypium barbadense]
MSSSRGKKAAVPSSKRRRGLGSSSVAASTGLEQVQLADAIRALLSTDPWERHHSLSIRRSSSCNECPRVWSWSGIYTDEIMEEEDMNALPHSIHISPSLCWKALTERHRKGVISIGPYVMHLARHLGLLNTVAQSSALTLKGQMSPQGITTMLHMRMIEHRRGTDPPQYHLSHAIDEEDLEDILDGVSPQHAT